MQIVVVSRNADVEAEVVRQRRLDDLLLHLAVERDGELLPRVVLPDVDQRVLLGELRERDAERALVVRRCGERRPSPASAGRSGARRSSAARRSRRRSGSRSRPQSFPISPADDRRRASARAAVEDADRGHLPLAVLAEPQPVARPHRAREHADVGDLLAGRAALDLEDAARDGAVGVATRPPAAAPRCRSSAPPRPRP